MTKYIILILVITGLITVAYLTLVMAVIEFIVGMIFIGILLLALASLWLVWKKKKN